MNSILKRNVLIDINTISGSELNINNDTIFSDILSNNYSDKTIDELRLMIPIAELHISIAHDHIQVFAQSYIRNKLEYDKLKNIEHTHQNVYIKKSFTISPIQIYRKYTTNSIHCQDIYTDFNKILYNTQIRLETSLEKFNNAINTYTQRVLNIAVINTEIRNKCNFVTPD